MEHIDFRFFAVPPMVLAFAKKSNLSVEVPAKSPKNYWLKGEKLFPCKKIADTIIGDTLEALSYFEERPGPGVFCIRSIRATTLQALRHPGKIFDGVLAVHQLAMGKESCH